MNHSDIRHKLSEYMDDEVTPEERTEIEAHLRICSACSDALSELRKTVEQIQAIEEVAPPAHLTGRIMATVRAEAEKKSFFRRLFFPLAVKVPLQAAALLFVAVTAFYIYEGAHPARRYAEAPMQGLAKTEAPSSSPEAAKQKAAAPERRAKQVEQAPGYRSLDMKDEYEQPSPPVALGRAAPAAGPGQKPAAPEEMAPASRAAAPSPRAYAPMLAEEAAAPAKREPAAGATERKTAAISPAGDARPGAGPLQEQQGTDADAEEMLAVTTYFVDHDLKDTMKVKGLRFFTRRVSDDLAGMEWLREMRVYRSVPCARRYLVDVELPGSTEKYLYCADKPRIRRLGIFTQVSGVWMERK